MELQTARGVRDFPPEEKIAREEVVNKLKQMFEIYGFSPMETPILERIETLSAKYAGGAEILKETFKLKDQGGRDLGLRYDPTVPLARFIGMNPNLKMPFKRYELGPVFRDGPIKLGRYRQFWQCDVDTIGVTSMLAEAEVLSLAARFFESLGLSATIKINNRQLLNGLIEEAKVTDKADDAILSLDKLEKIGEKGVSEELKQKGFLEKEVKSLLELIRVKELKKLKNLKNSLIERGIKELEELFSYLNLWNVPYLFEPSLARGLSYYTGTVYEVFVKELPSAVAAGGRYDTMIGNFLGSDKKYPAVGISFGLDTILDVLKLRNKGEKKKRSVTEIFVLPIGTLTKSMILANELREGRINTEIDLLSRGISKNMDYANTQGIPYVLFVGEDELKKKKFKLKDMATGKEEFLSIKEVISKLRPKTE